MAGKNGGDDFVLRRKQLLFRRLEVYFAYLYFTQLVTGEFDMGAGRELLLRGRDFTANSSMRPPKCESDACDPRSVEFQAGEAGEGSKVLGELATK